MILLKKLFTHLLSLTPLIVITLLTIFVSHNAFSQPGMYPTHDGEIHVIRSIHFNNELNRGQIPVRMIPELAYSFGYSTFQFNYPLPYYVASIFQNSGFSAATSWKLMQTLITFLSLGVFYLWMRCSVNKKASLTATVLFALVPFRLLTLYVTGQAGGYLALLFAPLIGLGLHQLLVSSNKTKSNGVLLSIAIAGMILSHLLSAIIFFIPLAGYAIWLLQKNFSFIKVKKIFLWSLLGIGLSSFYFLPFMLELSWIKLGHRILIDHTGHYPTLQQILYSPWGYGHSNSGNIDGMSFQIGFSLLIAWLLSLVIIFTKKSAKPASNKDNLPGQIFSFIFIFLFFLMLPISSFAWEILAPLKLIQFPWRLLAATSLVGSWLAGWSISKLKGKIQWLTIIFLIFISFYNVRNYTRPWPLDWRDDQSYIQDEQAYYGPLDISWELMPVTVTDAPSQVPNLVINASESGAIINKIEKPRTGDTRYIIEMNSSKKTYLNLSIWDLPVWEIKVNGNVIEKQIAKDGTILVPIEENSKIIEILLKKTNLQIIADTITLMSLLFLIVLTILSKYKHDKN